MSEPDLVALVRAVPGVAEVHPVRTLLARVPGADPDALGVRVRAHAERVDVETVVATAPGAGADEVAAAVAEVLRDAVGAAHPGRRLDVRVRVVDLG